MKYYNFSFYFSSLCQPVPFGVALRHLPAALFSLLPSECLTLARLREQMVGSSVCPASSAANGEMSL